MKLILCLLSTVMQVLANASASLSIENILFLGEIPNDEFSGHRKNNSVLSWCSVFQRPWKLLAPCSHSLLKMLGLHVLCCFWSPVCMRAHGLCLGRNTAQW